MKKITLLFLSGIVSISASAQYFAADDFNTDCGASNSFPDMGSGMHWIIYNPPTSGADIWTCTANGRPDGSGENPTNGVVCSGYSGGTYHLDTSYLITPSIYLSSALYPDNIFLRFDGKKDNNLVGGRLAIYFGDSTVSVSTRFDLDTVLFAGDTIISPLTGDIDSGQWVTHQINLTGFKDKPPFSLAFRYTSTTTSGTAWYLDNVNLTTQALDVKHIYGQNDMTLSVIGQSSADRITLAYNVAAAGSYNVYVYDMMGRELYYTKMDARRGAGSFGLNGLNLRAGMYCVRLANEKNYSTAKFLIQ